MECRHLVDPGVESDPMQAASMNFSRLVGSP